MRKSFAALAALSLTLAAAPAMAEPQVVVLTPGSSQNWTQQQPTYFLTTDAAQVLNDGLAYLSIGTVGGAANLGGAVPFGGASPVASSTFGYRRGMGNRGELAFSLGLLANAGGPRGFQGDVGLGWKQQLSLGSNLAIAVNGALSLAGFGSGGAIAPGLLVGFPLTFDAGLGHLTVQPRLQDPNVTDGTANTALEAAIGFQTPIASNWQLQAEVAPGMRLGGGGLSLPFGFGVRFSPTATSHVDLGIGQFNVTPGVSGSFGLVSATGHIGF